MAKRSKTLRATQVANARQAKASIRATIAQIKADRRARQQKERSALKAQHKRERDIERKRIAAFRHAGSVLKKKGIAGFTTIDFRKALPSTLFKKTGQSKSGLEKAIARLHDTISGDSKLVKVHDRTTRERLKSEGFVTRGQRVQISKEEVVTKTGEVKYRTFAKGGARISVENMEEEIHAYFAKHPGKRVGVQLGDGGTILYIVFDDPQSVIDYIESKFGSAVDKGVFDDILLIPAENVDAARKRLAARRRAEMKKHPRAVREVSETRKAARRAQVARAAKRYRARKKHRL